MCVRAHTCVCEPVGEYVYARACVSGGGGGGFVFTDGLKADYCLTAVGDCPALPGQLMLIMCTPHLAPFASRALYNINKERMIHAFGAKRGLGLPDPGES